MPLKRGRGDTVAGRGRLFIKQRGAVNLVPEKYWRQLKRYQTEEDVTADYTFPAGLTGNRAYVRLAQKTITEARLTIVEDVLDAISTPLVGAELDKWGSLSITETLVPDGTPIDTGYLVLTSKVTPLGNGQSIRITVKYPPGLAGEHLLKKKLGKPVVVPERFQSMLLDVTTITEVATPYTFPSVLTGDQSEILLDEEDQDRAKLQTTTQVLTGASPLISLKQTDKKQLETITETLGDLTQTITPSALTVEASVDSIGDGFTIKKVGTIPSILALPSYEKERPDNVPPRFRAVVPTLRFEQVLIGTAAEPTLGAGDLKASEEQIDAFLKRTSLTSRAAISLPVSLIGKDTSGFKEIVTVTETLKTPASPAVPTATQEVSIQDLGDGTVYQIVKSVPSVLAKDKYEKERPDNVPPKFRAVAPTLTHDEDTTGTAAEPTLAAGDLRKSETQIDTFIKRLSTTSRSGVTLPVSLTSFASNEDRQDTTITETLRNAGGRPTPTALQTTKTENLGDGTFYDETRAVASVFGAKASSIEIPDLVPTVFRSAFPTYTVEETSAGTIVDPPVLSTGDLQKTEKQIDVFRKTVTTKGRAGITLPQTAVLSSQMSEEYGGSITTTTGILRASLTAPPEGLLVVSSKVTKLGAGLWLEETEAADVFTELVGTEVDPRTGIVIEVKRKVVAAGTTGGIIAGAYVDVKTLDRWRSIRMSSKLDPTSLPATTTWESTVEHSFPNTLDDALFIWASAANADNYDFDLALLLDITQGYSGPCRALITEDYFSGAPGAAVSVTQFFPKGHTVGFAWAFASDSVAKSSARTFPIPPTLHDVIDLGTGVTLVGGTLTSTIPATDPIALPSPGTLINKDVNVERWRFGVFFRRITQIYMPG